MKDQKVINLWNNNQTNHLNLQQKIGLKLNDDSRGTYRTNTHIEFKITMIK